MVDRRGDLDAHSPVGRSPNLPLGAIVVGVVGLVHVGPGARELLVAGLVLSIVAAGALLVLVAAPIMDEVLVRRRLRRLRDRARS